ncbi:hypothetical protein GALMADRAFT_69357 [Galerina marginata CBS 339.88]|uniref:Protein-S-isoprenylcysteine O-methyltransferase n=1 Tax=Galerina marginata (strain CBS 339.88) TaxID=685588 RepID=A0A067SW06_GALM3|nr:hypothetical protein GALMADRAFT_69357 [Galerina marginata CBS 339.88]
MAGLHNSTTPPNSPPSADEKVPPKGLEIFIQQRATRFVAKIICWSAALAEIAIVLAYQKPHLPLSQYILSNLVFSGNAEKVRPTIPFFAATFTMVLGSYIRWCCYRALGDLFTFEMSIRRNHRLVMRGPYVVVRHPAYAGLILTVGGFVSWHASPGSWARECGVFQTTAGKLIAYGYVGPVSIVTVALLARMSKEDAMLKRKFGAQWDEWARRVPYMLIPGIY